MKSAESAGGMGTVTNGMQSTNEKDEVERNMESFQKSVTMGSAWFQSAKENVGYFIHLFYFIVLLKGCRVFSSCMIAGLSCRQKAYYFTVFGIILHIDIVFVLPVFSRLLHFR